MDKLREKIHDILGGLRQRIELEDDDFHYDAVLEALDQILALRPDKPPLLSVDDLMVMGIDFNKSMGEWLRQSLKAQWDIWNKWYEGG